MRRRSDRLASAAAAVALHGSAALLLGGALDGRASAPTEPRPSPLRLRLQPALVSRPVAPSAHEARPVDVPRPDPSALTPVRPPTPLTPVPDAAPPPPVPVPPAETVPPAPPVQLARVEVVGPPSTPVGVPFPVEAPPTPRGEIRPLYPLGARQRGEEGRVEAEVSVLADGRVARVDILRGSGFRELDEASSRALRQTRFMPARRAGQSVPSTVRLTIVFRLTDP